MFLWDSSPYEERRMSLFSLLKRNKSYCIHDSVEEIRYYRFYKEIITILMKYENKDLWLKGEFCTTQRTVSFEVDWLQDFPFGPDETSTTI
jgi:hypothetical protein